MKEIDLKKLSEPMEYKTRVWPGGTELAYIDARQAQDRLDEVCWIENWKVEYAEFRWELFAWVSIRINWEWVTKWDWWSESNIEKEKGAISDSFKRACVTWGLWRFLYSIKPSKTSNAPAKPKTTSNTSIYTMSIKDVEEVWEWKIYWKSVYLNWDKKTISDEQITKLKAHPKYIELPPK